MSEDIDSPIQYSHKRITFVLIDMRNERLTVRKERLVKERSEMCFFLNPVAV